MDDYQTCLLKAFGETEYSSAIAHKINELYKEVKHQPEIAALLVEARAANPTLDEQEAFFVLFSYDYFARTFAALKNC